MSEPGGIILGPKGDYFGEWSTSFDLDPRWEWCEITTINDPAPRYIKGACRHLASEIVPVDSGGETVANLCTTCDTQLPA